MVVAQPVSAPLTRAAGPGFADPDYEIAVEWLEAREAVIAALGFSSGFTHMEWYRKYDGEVVFGEIGARPPGARVVDLMNFATDGTPFVSITTR